MTEAEAIAYLAPAPGAPWRWDSEGPAIVWHDGTTLALTEEIRALLESQTTRRWPPFDAFVLLLAACRGKELRENELVQLSHRTQAGALTALLNPGTAELFVQAGTALGRIAALPLQLRKGLGVKRQLAALLGETQPEAGAAEVEGQREILRVLERRGVGDLTVLARWRDPMPAFSALAEAFGTVEEAALARRLRTGVAAEPRAVELPLLPAQQVRALLRQLAEQPEQAGLARAARDVLAALRLPRQMARSDELSSSGAADLSNRGPLDRLLLSELAHDDDVLAARLALHEALFIRREPPATPPAGAFMVLLDVGIRSWGTPRVFAIAVALALAALDEKRARFGCYRAAEGGSSRLRPLDLTTAAGLEAALIALETSAHPGPALREFFALPEWSPPASASAPEAVLILTPEAAADSDFQRALADVPRLPSALYFATVARDGAFALTLHPTAGRSPTCAALVDLQAITAEPPRREPDESDLPAYLRMRPAPLLLPARAGVRAALRLRDGRICAVTEKRELLTWDPDKTHGQRGARRHAHHLPGGRVLLLREEPDGRILCVTTTRDSGRLPLVFVDLAEEKQERVSVETRSAPLAVSSSNDEGILLFHYPLRLAAIDLRTGEVRDTRDLNEGLRRGEGRQPPKGESVFLRRCGPRHYRNSLQLVAAAWDERLLFVPLQAEQVDFMAVFQRPGEGVWGLTKDGAFGDFASGRFTERERWKLEPTWRWGELAPDASVLFLQDSTRPLGQGAYLEVARQGARVRGWFNGPDPAVGFALAYQPPERHMRTRLRRIGFTAGHRLALENRSGGWIVFDLKRGSGLVTSIHNASALSMCDRRDFQTYARARTEADSLEVARYPEGSRAFLDSRGLLHLCSAEAGAPEITLTIGDGQCGVWCSDSRVCGPSFYLGPLSGHLSEDQILGRIERFIRHALQDRL